MFLKKLTENEKIAFLNLANLAVMVDNEATYFEDTLLRNQIEMCGIDNFMPKYFNVDELLEGLKDSSKSSKKIIYMELTAICLADDLMHEKEVDMMEKVEASFNLSEEEALELKEWAAEFKSIMDRGIKLTS